MTTSVNMEAAGAETSRGAKWAIALFFVVIFLPGGLNVGVNLTPSRIYLIVMAIPLMLRFLRDTTLRITVVDVMVFLAIFWRLLALAVNHPIREVLNATASSFELFFGYLLTRVFVRTAADYRFFFKCFLITLLAFLPFALLEFTTRQRVLRRVFSVILTQPRESFGDQIRFGFMRVQMSFEHAIQFGSFCVVGFANAFYVFSYRYPRNLIYMVFVGFITVLALSSTSTLTIALQSGLILYERMFRAIRAKWFLLPVLAVLALLVFQTVVSMNFVDFVGDVLVYNPYVADGRTEIYRYGIQEVIRNPIFGIGHNDWRRPFWREHPTVDTFWLASTMRYGVPHIVFMLGAFIITFFMVASARNLDDYESTIRKGYLIALFSMVLMLSFHGARGAYNLFLLGYLGVGVWFYNPSRPERTRNVRRARQTRTPRVDTPRGGKPLRSS